MSFSSRIGKTSWIPFQTGIDSWFSCWWLGAAFPPKGADLVRVGIPVPSAISPMAWLAGGGGCDLWHVLFVPSAICTPCWSPQFHPLRLALELEGCGFHHHLQVSVSCWRGSSAALCLSFSTRGQELSLPAVPTALLIDCSSWCCLNASLVDQAGAWRGFNLLELPQDSHLLMNQHKPSTWKSPVCTSNPCSYWLEYSSSLSWQLLSAFASSLLVLFLWGSVKVCWQFLEALSNPHWFLSFLLCLITPSLYTLVLLAILFSCPHTLEGIVLFLSSCWISDLPVLCTCLGLQTFPTQIKPIRECSASLISFLGCFSAFLAVGHQTKQALLSKALL